MSVGHYENFPVASILLPPKLREPVAAIYSFARTADDFSDEGDFAPAQRLQWLQQYQQELDAIAEGKDTEHPIFVRLRPVIAAHDLPLQLFRDLLDAFAQDVVKDRYDTHAELMDYCRRSANPIGRLLLRLFKRDSVENLAHSDAVCSALQLINHWQDVAIDLGKGPQGRIYLPQEDMIRFDVTELQLTTGLCNAHWRSLMQFEVNRARALMLAGAPLGRLLPGRIGLEINTIIAGGLRILQKIESVDYDVFRHRPQLGVLDWPTLIFHALFR